MFRVVPGVPYIYIMKQREVHSYKLICLGPPLSPLEVHAPFPTVPLPMDIDAKIYSIWRFPSSTAKSELKSPATCREDLQGPWLMATTTLSIFKAPYGKR